MSAISACSVVYKFSFLTNFMITVLYCLQSLYLENGKVDCDTSSRIFGTSCMFSCDNGYQLSPDNSSTITCDITNSEGTWSPSSNVTCTSKYVYLKRRQILRMQYKSKALMSKCHTNKYSKLH